MIILLYPSKEDIELYGKEYGIQYEPDAKKCNWYSTKGWWGYATVEDGTLTEIISKNLNASAFLYYSPFKYVYAFGFPELVKDWPNLKIGHLDIRPFALGHTQFSDEEMMTKIEPKEWLIKETI